jgi:uncharacterized membrane protein
MNQTAGSGGPMSFIFSWGSGLIFLLTELNKLIDFSNLIDTPTMFYLAITTLMIVYLISVVVINSRLIKKNKPFPTVTVIYHFSGVIISYLFRFSNYEEAGKIYLLLLIYPVLSAMAVLYIYLDWQLAKKLYALKDLAH